MDLIATLYDSEGNEIELKPGHVMVMGKESCVQVPVDQYQAKMIYRPPSDYSRAERLIAEWNGKI